MSTRVDETDAAAYVGEAMRSMGRTSESDLLVEPLLDAVEAAKLLHVPRSTLYELVRSRRLPYVKVGLRGLRFTRADLAHWVSENSVRR